MHDDNVDVETSGIVVKSSSTVANNTIISSQKAISVIEGKSEISGNTLNGQLSIESDGNTITGNNLNGQMNVESSDNIISNNVVKNTEDYAIVLSKNATGNTIDNNDLYSAQGNGNKAIDNEHESNIISNNRILPDLKITVGNFEEGSNGSIVIEANENFTGKVSINITLGGVVAQTYTADVKNGTGVIVIKGLTAGNYTSEAISVLNDEFKEDHAFCNFTVSHKSSSGNDTNQNTEPVPDKIAPAPAKDKIKLTLKKVKIKNQLKS